MNNYESYFMVRWWWLGTDSSRLYGIGFSFSSISCLDYDYAFSSNRLFCPSLLQDISRISSNMARKYRWYYCFVLIVFINCLIICGHCPSDRMSYFMSSIVLSDCVHFLYGLLYLTTYYNCFLCWDSRSC